MQLDESGLRDGLEIFRNRFNAALSMYANTGALKLQNYARQNARWTDRTGHARQRLTGDVLIAGEGYKLRLAHGVDYGIFLELAHERRYAIIEETINTVGQNEILPGLNHLIDRLSGYSGGSSGGAE